MDFSDDKEKLLEKLLAQKGFTVMEPQKSKPDRSKQLEKFLSIVNTSVYSRNKANVDNFGSTIERTLTNVKVFQEAYFPHLQKLVEELEELKKLVKFQPIPQSISKISQMIDNIYGVLKQK